MGSKPGPGGVRQRATLKLAATSTACLLGVWLAVTALAAAGWRPPPSGAGQRPPARRMAITVQLDSTSVVSSGNGGAAGGARWSAVAEELVPRLSRRPEQAALEERWGVAPSAALAAMAEPPNNGVRIPRILHHVYFSDIDAYLNSTKPDNSKTKEAWGQSCRLWHQDWAYVFWDAAAANQLLERFYPDYVETFSKLDSVIKRADAIRYFIMHAIGGVYLDLDVECFQPISRWLQDADVVLQAPGPTNGVLASVPGHPLWEAVMQSMRRKVAENASTPVVELTGPGLMYELFLGVGGQQPPEWEKSPPPLRQQLMNSTMVVHPQGTYFHPCAWDDKACNRRVALKRALGDVPYAKLAGYHRFAGSWWNTENTDFMFGVTHTMAVNSEATAQLILCSGKDWVQGTKIAEGSNFLEGVKEE